MEIKEDIITFITPENIKIEVPHDKISEFCEKYCFEYISKSNENQIQFDNFKQGYKYFKPYYDFLICQLNFVSYPSLVDKDSYVRKGNKEGTKKLVPLIYVKSEDYNDFNHETFNILLNATDENLGINATGDNAIDGFFDANGKFLTNEKTHYHEETARIIMNSICAENGFLISDLFRVMKKGTFLYEDYLCYRLGFITAGTYRGNFCMFINPYLLSSKQKRLIEEYKDYGYDIIEESPNEANMDNVKNMTEMYRRGRK